MQDGELIGGLIGVRGIGPKMASEIVRRRELKQPLTPRHETLLNSGETPYGDIFECARRFDHIKADPAKHNIKTKITDIADLDADNPGTFVFFGKLKEKNLRDLNEKRVGSEIDKQNLWLNLTLEDDTSQIICTIDRFKYDRIGKQIVEEGRMGDWYLMKGKIRPGFRKIYVERYRRLE